MGGERHAGTDRLHAKRIRARRRIFITLCVVAFLLLCALAFGLRQSAVRISHIEITGADKSLAGVATEAMRGNYLGVIPRDSIFFFPENNIRANILSLHPEFAAISISREWMTGLSIHIENRVPIARWCGDATTTDCYLFDAKGFVFATTSADSFTSPKLPSEGGPVNSFLIFGDIANNNPIGSTLSNAEKLPAVFNFARQLSSFGSPVSSIVFRNDEVDDYLTSGSRVTYLLGDEQNAFTALSSAQNNFKLSDGSVEYIDLRFNGKVYLKKKND